METKLDDLPSVGRKKLVNIITKFTKSEFNSMEKEKKLFNSQEPQKQISNVSYSVDIFSLYESNESNPESSHLIFRFKI